MRVSRPDDNGMQVSESFAGEDAIVPWQEPVTAFVGPAPRGPAHVAVAIDDVEAFRRRFGSPAERSRLECMLGQYFDNGGRRAIVVRVPRAGRPGRLVLPGPGGALVLAATNPGPLEFLRAAVDYDGIAADDLWRFNLTIQRIRSLAEPLVEEQESWRNVSVCEDDPHPVAEVLAGSALVHVEGEVPPVRPDATPAGSYAGCTHDWRHSSPPADHDLIGTPAGLTGLHALDQVARVDFVCLVSGSPDADLGPVALVAAERYCRGRNALLLLDPPNRWKTVADVLRSQRDQGLGSANALTYFPPLMAAAAEGQPARPLGALGALAGALVARERPAAGRAPPGAPLALRTRLKTAMPLDEEEVRALVRNGVNALCVVAPGGLALVGDVTLASRGDRREWRHLASRRRALAIVSALAGGTRWAACQPSTPVTWQALVRQVSVCLAALHAEGVLAGTRLEESAYVKCDHDINDRQSPPTLIVGLALQRPGDFIAFRIAQPLSGSVVTEIAWQPGVALAG